MILSFDYMIIIFINYETNSAIIKQIKLAIINMIKQNLKLIQTLMYLFKFNLRIVHKSEKSHIVLDALN